MTKLLITSFDLEIGGVERSLINMLKHFDYEHHQVDVMLYSHTGDLMSLLPDGVELLAESPAYRTFRMPIKQIFMSGHIRLGLTRLMAKGKVLFTRSAEKGYKQLQYMWRYALPFLPSHDKSYDVAISYLWPHYFVAEKVQADVKIAWIHTDFSTVDTDVAADMAMWQRYDHIIAVSEACRSAFVSKYPSLENRVQVIENITSPTLVRQLANEQPDTPIFTDDRFKLVTVARLSHAKGIDRAIQAFKQLQQSGYHNLAWYVVGYGGDEEQLKTMIRDNRLDDAFILLGKQVNPYPYMKAADLYVQPSRYEGKAVTVGEAQILGKPVLITNYPTASSQIEDGVDGVICEQSVAGIVHGIQRLYDDHTLRKRIAAQANQRDYTNGHELEKLYAMMKRRVTDADRRTGEYRRAGL
ncbi:hypothetical protein JNUCC1_00714 [Lentibacillus sp. JNUCC-1]|uniref:glycosyltransferase n=1 Tax=Lentibacillus sp. JNUCC-1 TaxID=2654513 RepID=UPI0012E74334|nr:glycosyltransferase [Lentibacillus sp. JNUCC-1]MUV36910.1 hypothetical protein [Lentibacillus sp. JNUCC-1]